MTRSRPSLKKCSHTQTHTTKKSKERIYIQKLLVIKYECKGEGKGWNRGVEEERKAEVVTEQEHMTDFGFCLRNVLESALVVNCEFLLVNRSFKWKESE